MGKSLQEVMNHMEEFVKTVPDTALLAFSGFNGPQYQAAQEATSHWLKLLKKVQEDSTRDSKNKL